MVTALEFPTLEVGDAGLSALARGVIGSEILKIASEIRAMKAKGAQICNLTVGDFDPAYFPIPAELCEGTRAALAEGHTNYPPSDGVLVLREALVRFYERELGLKYPLESVLVAGGARPLLYGAYRTLIDPGDVAVYPVPSWNNNHYAYLSGARAVEIPVSAASNFFPTADDFRPHIGAARLLLINSPLNPTGTVIARDELQRIAELVLEENRRRQAENLRPVFLVYDQVYWMLTHGDARHETPVSLVPEIAPYTIMLDALSKSFCATGMRVGWGFMPPAVRRRMADILGHVGAWAPKAEQVATAALLDTPDAMHTFLSGAKAKVKERLDALFAGFSAMKREGLPVDAIAPQGAIYLSARFDWMGKTIRGRTIQTNDEIRKVLLEEAGLAVVPFQAFGLREENGWFRLSVGAVSMDDIQAAFPRLRSLMST
ncbi:aminotransferase class I/II-fold pyridoxal phosphate-dependent enzyme [Polyangium sp. y55x31]|uniref:pyridoxal phosphate-dependent aminotransferase n=1 Tax=Polyangium sp. y55x31 TaxID=3042688 RepID=UPI00248307FD|nr:aminotransferase class I/II-fold pyridoxal phosphate-dependent enzyme [Polyangium sp. y55x31]MDI1475182.1 aminotransferase class I/II-fold pyridoxal phosphate-dependent enzyme [Polyangium sp. y55x31]